MPAAVPAHYHDDDGGDARRPSAGAGRRHGRGAAAAARHLDRRGPALFPDADSLHDAGRLPLPRPVPAALAEDSRASPAAADAGPPGSLMRTAARLLLTASAFLFAACAVGPNYKR